MAPISSENLSSVSRGFSIIIVEGGAKVIKNWMDALISYKQNCRNNYNDT